MVKDKKNLIKLVLNTFISIKGPIILQNCPILSPSEPDQSEHLLIHTDSHTKVVLVIFQQYHYLEIEGGLHHFRAAYVLV